MSSSRVGLILALSLTWRRRMHSLSAHNYHHSQKTCPHPSTKECPCIPHVERHYATPTRHHLRMTLPEQPAPLYLHCSCNATESLSNLKRAVQYFCASRLHWSWCWLSSEQCCLNGQAIRCLAPTNPRLNTHIRQKSIIIPFFFCQVHSH